MSIHTKRTWVEISRSALVHNVHTLSKIAAPSGIAVVVKSNAYGHGIEAVSTLLEHVPQVSWLCTAGIEEALYLRHHGSNKNLLVMAYYDAPLKDAIINKIDLAVYELSIIRDLNACAAALGTKARIHIKVDTGLSRLGVMPHNVLSFVQTIRQQYPAIDIIGIFTHLADTNNPDLSFTYEQLDIFNKLITLLQNLGICIPVTHALSSGALTLNTNYPYDIVRVGTNVYGFYKSEIQQKRLQSFDPQIMLRPIASWKTRIIHITSIGQSVTVGYARTYKATHNSRIALLGVGYADGYPRVLSNKAHVDVDGIRAPVVGLVSMNIIAVDVTHIPHAHTGMIATLIGSLVPADQLAHSAGTINNELVTRINSSIPRHVIE